MKDAYAHELFKHNGLDQKIGSTYYEKDTAISEYKYELDELGIIKEGRAFDLKTGKQNYGYKYSYDDQGNQITIANLNAIDSVYSYYQRTFNEDGITIAEQIEDTKGKPTLLVKYEYRPKADSSWTEQTDLLQWTIERNQIPQQ